MCPANDSADTPQEPLSFYGTLPPVPSVDDFDMVGRQRTFDLIPTSLVVSNFQKPPMTSKQAKKAHQLATKGPRISRAEQRRRDAEELARQKKEYEREKASAKAKAAREKKAVKKQSERNAQKKMGIPEPNKFVRASQPMISKFVKKGKKRTWEIETVEEEESDTPTIRDDIYNSSPERPAKKLMVGGESGDEYGGFPSFSQSELGAVMEKIDSSAPSRSRLEGRLVSTAVLTPLRDSNYSSPKNDPVFEIRSAEALPTKKSSDEFAWEPLEDMDDLAATQLLSEVANAIARTPQLPGFTIIRTIPDLPPPKPACIIKTSPYIPRTETTHANTKEAHTVRTALQEVSINVPTPPLPQTKAIRAISFARPPTKPPTLPRMSPQPVLVPSATQAFLEDHLDDFFPSPSQEIRELLDNIDDLPTNTQIARELDPEPDPPITKSPKADLDDLFCTQDLILSSPDVLEITTPCPSVSKSKRSTELPSPTPTPVSSNPLASPPKRRFFEEKEEDLLYAAIQESKALVLQQEQRDLQRRLAGRAREIKMAAPPRGVRGQSRGMAGRAKRTFQRTVSNATDYGDNEFHDCEEELLALF